MNNYLVQVQEIYRVNTEKEAQDLISSAKEESGYELIKYNCEHKEKKSKGDVIDDWYNDYKDMQSSMIYGEKPSFDELIAKMEKLENMFHA